MTIAELYEYAKALEIENLPIYVTYECSDCWYDFNKELTKNLIETAKDKVEFQF